jgi:PBSX family phage terminase large subunit
MNEYAEFDEKQVEYLLKTQECWLNVAEGGKRGGKNVINSLAFCILLENHNNKLHLIAGTSIANAKLNIIDCDGYGIMNYFSGRCHEGKYKNKECLYVNCSDGKEKVLIFAGGAKANDYVNIKGNTYGMAYITEANECHPSFLNEAMDRTLSSDNRKVFHDLNPKPPNHWYYTDFLKFHEEQESKIQDYGYNYGHFNIFNNLSISDDKLKQVLATYNKNSIWYKRDILGNRIASAGILFGEIANNQARYMVDKARSGFITMGVDFGKNGSAHAFCSQRISRNFDYIDVLKSSEMDCTENGEQVSDDRGIGEVLTKLEIGFTRHIKEVQKKWGMIEAIFCDGAEPELIEFLRKVLIKNSWSIPIYESIKIPISSRIHLWGILLMQDRIKFVKNETDEIVRGLQEATQDVDAEDDRYLDDGTSDIDILDANNYGIEKWYKQLLRIGG